MDTRPRRSEQRLIEEHMYTRRSKNGSSHAAFTHPKMSLHTESQAGGVSVRVILTDGEQGAGQVPRTETRPHCWPLKRCPADSCAAL